MSAPWKGKKRMAVYIRRSEGESGNTKAQLKRIEKAIEDLERKQKINKVNRGIVGKDIERKKRFNRRELPDMKGDIFNEGEGASGFSFAKRPVFAELLKRMKAGEYDGILVESMDRIARDWTGLAHLAANTWRDEGKVIFSLSDSDYLADNPFEEAVINTKMTWGGVAKKAEIDKAEEARIGDNADKGFFKGSEPEFLGTKGKRHGLDYRRAYELMKAYGENAKGNLNKPSAVGAEFGKDNKWASSWYRRLSGYDALGVLEAWFDAYEAINAYTLALGGYPRNQWRSNPGLKRIVKASKGFFAYPGGVNIAGTDEFVKFPSPLVVGLEELASVENPMDLEAFLVEREEKDAEFLNGLSIWQTQQRSRK